MAETYEQRMSRLSRLHFLHNDSDFSHTSVEEFETWKGRLGLSEHEQTDWFMRRNFLSKYFDSLAAEYETKEMSPEVFISLLCKAATEKDHALLGRVVQSAFQNKPLSAKRLVVAPYLRSYALFLKWFKGQWKAQSKGTKLQNEIKNDLEKLTGQKISGSTIEDWMKPSSNSR